MASLNHQACGVLDLASAARCPDRVLLSKHSNQNEKPDLGQESDAHDRDRKEHVARRERAHECLASCEAPGVNHSGWKMFRFQMQTARHASFVPIPDHALGSATVLKTEIPIHKLLVLLGPRRRARSNSQSYFLLPWSVGRSQFPSSFCSKTWAATAWRALAKLSSDSEAMTVTTLDLTASR